MSSRPVSPSGGKRLVQVFIQKGGGSDVFDHLPWAGKVATLQPYKTKEEGREN